LPAETQEQSSPHTVERNDMGAFEGRVALVTGAGSGIGRASALAFAREGARVAVADIVAERARDTVVRIEAAGGQAASFPADVTDSQQVEALVGNVVGAFGRLDCALNNAGLGPGRSRTADLTEEEWDRVMALNLKGVWLCMKYEIAHMLKQGGGAIVNTASVVGVTGFTGAPAYVASKHGVVGLTKAAALEYATSNIRVNAVCPGVTHTPMTDGIVAERPRMAELYRSIEPMGRLAEPEEIAAAAVWLCSDAASFVTGHSLLVDGGLAAQ